MSAAMRAVCAGVHVLDVLVRPVEAIPEGQGGQLVDEIKITGAGSAGGTAITLAKLGAEVRCAGAIGRDAAGEMLMRLLEAGGIDTSLIARREDVQTSASVLPIRPSGERPALHVVGANATFGPDDVPTEAFEWATHLHLGGPELMGGDAAAQLLGSARSHGVVTSADVLAPGEMGVLEWIAAALPHLDYFLPNDDQVLGFTGADDLEAGCRGLIDRGAGCIGATCGADGAIVVTPERTERVPAFEVDVVDTTGCGDAFSAGFIRGIALGREPLDAARLGCAAAALVAGGLGSDYGRFTLADLESMAEPGASAGGTPGR